MSCFFAATHLKKMPYTAKYVMEHYRMIYSKYQETDMVK